MNNEGVFKGLSGLVVWGNKILLVRKHMNMIWLMLILKTDTIDPGYFLHKLDIDRSFYWCFLKFMSI